MTSLYLTATAADAAVTAGSGTKWATGFTPGASSTHLNKNTVVGPTAPLQMTDGATAGTDGTDVAWYTPPLRAVTIAGAISCLFWDRENATANNVAPTIRIEHCSGDGTVLATIVAETTSHGAAEMATTAGGASDAINVTAGNVTDTTLSDGDRLRITLWIDDAAGQGGTGSMASGGRGEFWVNGPNGAAGQSQLAFTEIVQPVSGPRMVTTPETSFTTTTTPKTLTAVGALSGDLMVAMYGGDNFSTACSAAAVTTTGGTTGAWTEVLEALVGNTTSPWKSNAWADVTGDGDATASLDRTQASAQVWGGWLAHFREHGGIGNSAELVDSASDVVSLTVSEGSTVLAFGVEWDHLAVTAFTPSGAHDIERNAGLTAVSWYAGFWVGQSAGTRNYGIVTNGSTSFSLTVIEILAPAGVTSVGKDLGLVWDTRAAIGDTLQTVWDVRSAIADTLGLVWNLRSALGDPLDLRWDVRAAVGDPLQLVWNVQTLSTPVGKDLALIWNTRAALGDPLQLVWNTRAVLGDTLQTIWNTRAAIGDPVSLVWNTRAAIGDPLDLRWDVRAAVADTLQLIWNVQVIGLTAVGKDLGLLWNLKAPAGDNLQVMWDTRAILADILDLRWGIRTPVGKASQLVWHVRTVAGDTLTLVWDVDSQAYIPLFNPAASVRLNAASATFAPNPASASAAPNPAAAAARPNPAEAT